MSPTSTRTFRYVALYDASSAEKRDEPLGTTTALGPTTAPARWTDDFWATDVVPSGASSPPTAQVDAPLTPLEGDVFSKGDVVVRVLQCLRLLVADGARGGRRAGPTLEVEDAPGGDDDDRRRRGAAARTYGVSLDVLASVRCVKITVVRRALPSDWFRRNKIMRVFHTPERWFDYLQRPDGVWNEYFFPLLFDLFWDCDVLPFDRERRFAAVRARHDLCVRLPPRAPPPGDVASQMTQCDRSPDGARDDAVVGSRADTTSDTTPAVEDAVPPPYETVVGPRDALWFC